MDAQFRDSNRDLWDRLAAVHRDSDFYDVPGFREGKTSLKPIELAELGNVGGKSLLHLQCHFGLDTLSWARAGASVTGIDISPVAISTAKELAAELKIPARFECCEVFAVPECISETFDIVFTSYGALCWLDDIDRWARIAAEHLRPGGILYLVEFHPIAHAMADDGTPFGYDYFHKAAPDKFEDTGTYADRDADVDNTAFEWNHTLGDVVSAVCNAGLRVEFLHEFPFSAYDCFDYTQPVGPDDHRARVGNVDMPLMYSLRAHKPTP